MKRSVRDQILEILSAIQDSVKYAKKASPENADIAMRDCREALLAVVQSLEKGLPEARFSFYVEPLDALAGEILAYPESPINLKEVKKRVSLLKRELLVEPEVKLEIAFFPYKAAMWDSLESVWKAACADTRCDVSVVPVPYCEKAPGGAALRTRCERENFPDYVPTVDYREYDISIIKPDIAYIHNPFDGYNTVTEVHPDYHSHRLKKYVKSLVYIPYYVLGGDMSGQNYIIALNAANVVITRDEATARVLKRTSPRKDVAGLGSPKVDRVLHYEKNKPEMPEEWRAVVGDKKLFFLNTSLSALLQSTMEDHGFRYIEKLKNILDSFEGRDDAALLWRPHPLSGATLQSMRPHLLEEYKALLDRLREKRLGVLDESSDLQRAIALSSGYIGEGSSSVVILYAMTGKPMYILNYQVSSDGIGEAERKEYARSVLFGVPWIDGDYAWAACVFYPGLLRVNLKTGQAELVAEIPGETLSSAYGRTIRAGDRLYMAPYLAGSFADYDLNTGELITTRIPPEYKEHLSFASCAEYDGKVFYFPGCSPAIVCRDTRDGSFTYYTDWFKELDSPNRNPLVSMFGGFICTAGSKAYLLCLQHNKVLEFDMGSCRSRLHTVGDKGFGFMSSVFDGHYIWLAQFKECIPVSRRAQDREAIIRWDPKSGDCRRFDKFPEGFAGGEGCFGAMVEQEGSIYIFPRTSNMILRLDTSTGEMSELKIDAGFDFTARKADYYCNPVKFIMAMKKEGGAVCAVATYDNSLIEIDLETGGVKKHKLETDDPRAQGLADGLGRFRSATHYYVENPLFSASRFLDAYFSGDIEAQNPKLAEQSLENFANSDGSCGEKTHEYVMMRAGASR